MTSFFPRTTVQWHLEEPAALRRFSLWIVPMAVLTGLVVRGVRAALLANLDTSWASLGFYYGLTAMLFFSALTAHVGNYPLRQWLWRVPVFAAVESAAEAAASALLIWVGREPFGTTMATWGDWSTLAWGGLAYRLLAGVIFGGIMAAIVVAVRATVLKADEVQEMDAEGDRETGELRRESREMAGPIERVIKH
jgi:hypothetical protein